MHIFQVEIASNNCATIINVSLGGWDSYEDYNGKKIFPEEFISIIHFSPFNFSKNELEGLIEALECVLRKVPVSDFHGIYQHDEGYTLMGVKGGKPFMIELGYSYVKNNIERYLNSLN